METCPDLFRSDKVFSLPAFIAMSTLHFKDIADRIGFVGEYNDDLRQISRNFCEQLLPTLGISTPQTKVSRDFSDPAKSDALWQQVFDDLSQIEMASEICQWLQNLKTENDVHMSKIQYGSGWENLVFRWATGLDDYPLPDLSLLALQNIKIIWMQEAIISMTWVREIGSYEEYLPSDEWETYAFQRRGTGTWLTNRINQRQRLHLWVDLMNLLSADELVHLDQWGYDMMEQHDPCGTKIYFSLVDFAVELRELGYLSVK